jgi:ABC-type nitrate/sulfonate/bicarbonate transport system permease component
MITVTTDPATFTPPRRRAPRWLGGVLGVVGLLVVWQIAGMTLYQDSHVIPAPTAIVGQVGRDGAELYWVNAIQTITEAAQGWLWGNGLAIVVAIVFVQIPLVERGLLRLAVASYCLPIIAIGPVLTILLSGDTPKVVLAALSVFFTTLIAMLVGLRSADRTSLDVIHAYGGTSWTALRKVRLTASLPSLFAGLRIAAPAALLGAIIGEYMGADRGLGVAMINSQQSLQTERTWAFALLAAAVAGVAYGFTALVGRLLTPWAPRLER